MTQALSPREMVISPPGQSNVPVSRRFPEIRGGQCEHCGTIDRNYPGDVQYKFCPHYKGMAMKCTYCPANSDHEEVVRNSKLMVREHPYRPGTLLTLCGSLKCSQKFEQEFNIKP